MAHHPPCAAAVGFVTWWIAHLVSGATNTLTGAIVDAIILLAMVAVILMRARRNPVDASNVNDDWGADAETVDSSLQAHEKVAAGVTTGNAPGAATAAHGVINDASSAAHTTTIEGK